MPVAGTGYLLATESLFLMTGFPTPSPNDTRISVLDQGSVSEHLPSHETLQIPRTGIFKQGEEAMGR